MHTIAEQPSIDKFRESLRKTIDGFKPDGDLWMKSKVLFYSYVLLARNRAAVRRLHVFMNACDNECTGECLEQVYAHASQVRDNLLRLEALIPDRWPFAHVKAQVENMLYDWDDIVEDAYIGKDPEIRGLIGRLAETL